LSNKFPPPPIFQVFWIDSIIHKKTNSNVFTLIFEDNKGSKPEGRISKTLDAVWGVAMPWEKIKKKE
jgi:hypothetical protein